MLDAVTVCAAAFFSSVDLKNAYYSVMSARLTWLSTQYPNQFSSTTALHYHSQAIQLLRRRFRDGIHNDETCFSALCAMQTDVSFAQGVDIRNSLTGLGAFRQSKRFIGS